jgi:tRNA-2-methylthio-N6-dimethylallyladenosine synthase
MNSYDSNLYEKVLQQYGFTPVSRMQNADLVIINTCAVRDRSVQKAASAIGRVCHWKRSNAHLLLCVVGCASDLLSQLSHHNEIDYIHGALNATMVDPSFTTFLENHGFHSTHSFQEKHITTCQKSLSTYIPIIFGCDSFCTYCIVPHVRGREKSRPVQDILDDIHLSLQQGAKEIILLGQNVNCYGKDFHPSISFSDLLETVASMESIQRLDFLTSHPREFDKSVLDVVRHHESIVKRFHFPVQHGDNEILRRMKRGYTAEEYIEKISWIRSYFPFASITTDIIVGFPGETEEAFQNTLSLLQKVQFDTVFGAVYSPRPNTKAAIFDDQVPFSIGKRRLNVLLETQKEITKKNLQRFLHQTNKVFVLHAYEEKIIGKSWEDRLIQFTYPKKYSLHPGDIVQVHIDCVQDFTLKGQIVP